MNLKLRLIKDMKKILLNMQESGKVWCCFQYALLSSQYSATLKLREENFCVNEVYFKASEGNEKKKAKVKKKKANFTLKNNDFFETIDKFILDTLTSTVQENFCTLNLTPISNLGKRKLIEPIESTFEPINLIAWGKMVDNLNLSDSSISNELELNLLVQKNEKKLEKTNLPLFTFSVEDIFNQIIENGEDNEVIISVSQHQFVIPNKSKFLMSDMDKISPLKTYGKLFSFFLNIFLIF